MKNKTMRVAALLLALTLMTSCFVGGTFAKYVTGAETQDTARVAKWGVMLTVSGDGIFSKEYEDGNKTVISSNTDKLVAPGTKNDTGITFTIKGTPEVAFKVTVGLGTNEDVFLKADTYTDYTELKVQPDGSYKYEEFTLAKDYYPVVFTLKHTYANGAQSIAAAVAGTGAKVETSDGLDTITGTLAQINAVLANVTANMQNVAPNYVLDDDFELTWAWAFGDPANNKADTLLGNLAAGTASIDTANYNLELEYNFSITIEQLD